MSTSSPLGWPARSAQSLPPAFRSIGRLGWPHQDDMVAPEGDAVPRETQSACDAPTEDHEGESPVPRETPELTAPSLVPREVPPESEPSPVPRETPDRPAPPPPPVPGAAPRHGRTGPTAPWSGTRIVTVSNQKGGVGKTTTAVNIAAAMALDGLRVLVVDMDPQGNASTALSIPHTSGTAGIYDVIIDGVPLAEVVQPCPQVPNLLCAPATIDLAGAEIELVPLVARENRLRRALEVYLSEQEQTVDLVVIDCPPSLGLLTVNAFVAAREVLIPIQCEYYALEGLSQLMKNVELIQQHLNADLRISTILLTMYDGRTRLAADVADQVREYFGDRVLRTVVPRSVRVSEAPSHGETVMTYDPGSAGALSYAEAAAEMRRQEV